MLIKFYYLTPKQLEIPNKKYYYFHLPDIGVFPTPDFGCEKASDTLLRNGSCFWPERRSILLEEKASELDWTPPTLPRFGNKELEENPDKKNFFVKLKKLIGTTGICVSIILGAGSKCDEQLNVINIWVQVMTNLH